MRAAQAGSPEHRLYLREEELDQAVDLLFLAARRFWRAAEGPLAENDLGPAHYRALAAIRRSEGLTVSALRERLNVRKQSLARVLAELETAEMIARTAGLRDRRERTLSLTETGRAAERSATAALRERLALVFRAAGAEAVSGARLVLAALAETEG
ncbi:MAG: MarR family transcriptional regulator [Hyphomonadaceae bacterium]